MKNEVKNKLILLYQNFWKAYHQQFNDIFKVIAKEDYPSKYASLKEMIISMLTFLSQANTQQMIESQ